MKKIPLTQGQVALVDDEDYERLNVHKWRAQWSSRTKSYYALRSSPRKKGEKRTTILMHREVMQAKPGECVDHLYHETCDNQKANLRLCTVNQNGANRGAQTNNTSGFKGVGWHKRDQKWYARISVNGKVKNLGYYSTPEEAAVVYDKAALGYHGEFAVTNKSLGLLNE